MEISAGEIIYDIPEDDNLHILVTNLIELEENRILHLRSLGLKVNESILLHFVRMYILRWAIPIVEIENNGTLKSELVPQIQQRFWLCMYGRALDDIHDRDSNFFTITDSTILLTIYSSLLNINISNSNGQDLIKRSIKSLTYSKNYLIPDQLTFDIIKNDVCNRVEYFLADNTINISLAAIVNQYVGVLLGFADLEDCIADGIGRRNSTQMSSHLYATNSDQDLKIHLDGNLLNWYRKTYHMLDDAGQNLFLNLKNREINYSQKIITMELEKRNIEFGKLLSVEISDYEL